ncbi:MAG: regulatory protein RecX [Granulosicoccaceae bacterium]
MNSRTEIEFDDQPSEVGDYSTAEKKERPPELLAEYKAIELLARREHSRVELEDKLGKREFSSEAIEIALDALAERGWQSDERFAELFIEQRANKGKGPRLVRQELIKRGIDSALASQCLRDTEVDWEQVADRVLANRFGADGDYAKMRRFLEQRGFESSQARHAIRQLQSQAT